MSLTEQVKEDVSNSARRNGADYYENGRVEIYRGDKESINASVQGTRSYYVAARRERQAVKVSCDCPYFQEHFAPCKHIWAVMLAAEDKGYLQGAKASDSVYLEPEDPPEYDDEPGYRQDVWGGNEFDDFEDESSSTLRSFLNRPAGKPRIYKYQPKQPNWKQLLSSLNQPLVHSYRHPWPAGREILYLVDAADTKTGHGLSLEVAYRERKKNGEWSKPKSKGIDSEDIQTLPNVEDRRIMSIMLGAEHQYSYGYSSYRSSRYVLRGGQEEMLIPAMCGSGRCFLRDSDELRPLQWDSGDPWEFFVEVTRADKKNEYEVGGWLRRGDEKLPLAEPVMLLKSGLVFFTDRVSRWQGDSAFEWVLLFRQHGAFRVPVKQKDELLPTLLRQPSLPRLQLPEELQYEEVSLAPKPHLKIKPGKKNWGPERLIGELCFDYDGEKITQGQAGAGVFKNEGRRLIRRDLAAEQAAAGTLHELGFRRGAQYMGSELELVPNKLPKVVRILLAAGWHVEAEGKLFRQAGEIAMEVTSGIDWFELHGTVQFGDTTAKFPELLAALKKGETSVQLGDGTFGVLPEEWLKKYGVLAGLGSAKDDHLRFSKAQVGLLDALLATQPQATGDEVFSQAREELRKFQGIAAANPTADFVGQLREYQRDGLGWLHFLQKFGFGGCLADDMGLGKTVQVLALLESRRELRALKPNGNGKKKSERIGPSLVVVPRSLIFNWKQEGARFTPQMRVLDHTGLDRLPPGKHFDDYDLILTTYGTLRRDALEFKDVKFDYCILDESQAVKNARTESAKAVRLLQGNHRLALSGTPIENHFGELWSLFDFLNPGMLGTASVFQLGGAGARNPSEETRGLLAKALRPFILRRTKDQVAKDLPEKSEQTLYCDLEPVQRKQYDELREHYRRTLLAKIEKEGMNKAKIMVLEALLRLRQAACHPGLIDKTKVNESSAKLDVLLPQIAEVAEEGHKALVFSQFTSLLDIVKKKLKKDGIPYEYLDGKTRNRAEIVERFQNNPDCKLFLISLKAGGLGLNLTAAEYVFLLDPWWNPAVEAQAIDRAHRIGQTKPVFAYRLIARDTVEEKVLELQNSKRDLADAIINADNSLIRNLGREDLELLLS